MTDIPDDIVARHLDVARMGVQDAVRLYLATGSKVKVDDVITLMRSVEMLIRSVERMTLEERTALADTTNQTGAELFKAVMALRQSIVAMAFPNGRQPPACPPGGAAPSPAPVEPSRSNVVPLPSRKPPPGD